MCARFRLHYKSFAVDQELLRSALVSVLALASALVLQSAQSSVSGSQLV